MITNDTFLKAYHGSYYTITGCGGDLQEWIDGYNDLLAKNDIGFPKEWISFTGKEYNEMFGLTGQNRYDDDLTFLAFPIDDMRIQTLAIFKIKMGDRWFDDIVDNDLRREGTTFDQLFASRVSIAS